MCCTGGRHLLVEFSYTFPGKSAGLRLAAVQGRGESAA